MINLVFTLISAILGIAMFGAVLLANPHIEAGAERAPSDPVPASTGARVIEPGNAPGLMGVDDVRTGARVVNANVAERPGPWSDQATNAPLAA